MVLMENHLIYTIIKQGCNIYLLFILAPDDHGGDETDMERCAAVCAAFPNTDGMPILGF